MTLHLTHTQWGDVVTLGLVTLMWAVMLFYEIRQVWLWDALGRAMTMLTACLMVSYGLTAANMLDGGDLYPAPVRWTVRTILVVSGVVTIWILAADQRRLRAEARRP